MTDETCACGETTTTEPETIPCCCGASCECVACACGECACGEGCSCATCPCGE